MSEHLLATFKATADRGQATFVGFVTAGYPTKADTISVMQGMEKGGTDVIELGVPFTDPLADGATIQKTNEVALAGSSPVSLADCIGLTREFRDKGGKAPIILMGYYNPLLAYGLEKLMLDCKAAGVNGFIVVDLPPEEGAQFVSLCGEHGLSQSSTAWTFGMARYNSLHVKSVRRSAVPARKRRSGKASLRPR